jgi:ribosomal protein S6E (S10)
MRPNMLRILADRPVRLQHALAVCGSLALAACASKYSQVPARLDLAPFGRIALVTFAADQPNIAMGSLATQRFAEALLANQSGVELLELNASDSSLKKLGSSVDGVELAKALGKDRNVPAVFVGSLKISNVKPRGHIDASGMNVRAGVSAELTVRLLSTSTGGTVWRSSSVASGTLGGLNISDRLPSIGIRDKDEAYGQMVSQLIAEVTRDLRPTWVKQ